MHQTANTCLQLAEDDLVQVQEVNAENNSLVILSFVLSEGR